MSRLPEFLVLSTPECTQILARNSVGRITSVDGAGPPGKPIAYALEGTRLVTSRSLGVKPTAGAPRPVIAFEVTEGEGPFDWRSVIVRGSVHRLANGKRSSTRYALQIDRMIGRMARRDHKTRAREPSGPQRLSVAEAREKR